MTALPNAAASAMNAGMPTTSSRVTVLHARQRSSRSTFSPAENSAITTASSVTCSISVGVLERVDPVEAEHGEAGRGDDAEAEVDQRRGERALVLVRERADRREDRDAGERQPEAPRVAELEACAGRDQGEAGTSGPSGCGGSGSSGGGASGPSGTFGASRAGVGSAGTVGLSGTTGWAGSAGWGISRVVAMGPAYPDRSTSSPDPWA